MTASLFTASLKIATAQLIFRANTKALSANFNRYLASKQCPAQRKVRITVYIIQYISDFINVKVTCFSKQQSLLLPY